MSDRPARDIARTSDRRCDPVRATAEKQNGDGVAARARDGELHTILEGIGEGFYAVDREWRIIHSTAKRPAT